MSSDIWIGPYSGPDTYELLTLLGGGGEGEVWKAVLPLSDEGRRTVAVKILHADTAPAEPQRWERFGHLLRSLSHPGLVRVLDVFLGPARHTRENSDADTHAAYVVMDYVDGPTLREWCTEHPDASAYRRLQMLRTIASALDDMHSGTHTGVPVAHGDVKPANVVVGDDDDTIVLVDLGLTRLTDATGVAGRSAPYAAPEMRGDSVQATPEADRYAFTATVAQVLTGQPIPTTDDGWLDPVELEYRLRTSTLTQRRPILVRRILDALDASPEARPNPLGSWLDATADSLSEITAAPAPSSRPALAATPTAQPAAPVTPEAPVPAATGPTPPSARAAFTTDGEAPPTQTDQGFAQYATPTHPAAAVDPAAATTVSSGLLPAPAPFAPAPFPPPPASPGRAGPVSTRPRRRRSVFALGALGTVVLVVAAVLMAASLSTAGATARTPLANTNPQMVLEPVGSAGQEPFANDVSAGDQPMAVNLAAAGSQLRGDTPGLYGGTNDNSSCDPGKLVAFLQANPDKAAAWAGAQGIQTDQIAAYVAGLTPVVLRVDTRVTNHGFRDGDATTLQSTLQAGSSVLIDQTGVPRVRCACGNPLAEPLPLPAGAPVSGSAWNGYTSTSAVTIVPAPAPVDRFTVVDPKSGKNVDQGVGSRPQIGHGAGATTTPPNSSVPPSSTIPPSSSVSSVTSTAPTSPVTVPDSSVPGSPVADSPVPVSPVTSTQTRSHPMCGRSNNWCGQGDPAKGSSQPSH